MMTVVQQRQDAAPVAHRLVNAPASAPPGASRHGAEAQDAPERP